MTLNRTIGVGALVLLLAGTTAMTWTLHGRPRAGVDDANIFFSYAENLATGKGITYARNGERVEGFTSMLWMLLCTAMFALGLNETGVLALCFVLLVLTLLLFLRTLGNALPPCGRHLRACQGVFLALVLSSPAYVTWMTITLMDTCLWGLILAGMTLFLSSPPRSRPAALAAAGFFALAPAARPEALLVGPVFLVLLWLRCRSIDRAHATRFCLPATLSFLAVAAGLTVFRLSYFGYPLPNTFYAKVSPALTYNLRAGAGYLSDFVLSGSIVGVVCLVLFGRCAYWLGRFLARLRLRAAAEPRLLPPVSAEAAVLLGALTLLVVPVLTGGDHFDLFRFYQPAYPLLCMAGVLSASHLSATAGRLPDLRRGGTGALGVVAVGAVVACWLYAFAFQVSWHTIRRGAPMKHEFRIADRGIAAGLQMNRLLSGLDDLPNVGVVTAGGIARTYAGPITDLMGLNNTVVGHYRGKRTGIKNHAAFERDVFFLVEPSILLTWPESRTFDGLALKGLFQDRRFAARWRHGVLSSKAQAGDSLHTFFQQDFVANLPPAAGLEFRKTLVWSEDSQNWGKPVTERPD